MMVTTKKITTTTAITNTTGRSKKVNYNRFIIMSNY